MAKITKKAGKKVSKKAEKKLAPGTKMVAGRVVDATPIEFEKASIDDFVFGGNTRESSKYYNLIQAALELEDGECIAIAVGDDEDPSKKRLGIGMVISNKVKKLRSGYRYRTKLNAEKSHVVVACYAEEEEEEEESEE